MHDTRVRESIQRQAWALHHTEGSVEQKIELPGKQGIELIMKQKDLLVQLLFQCATLSTL